MTGLASATHLDFVRQLGAEEALDYATTAPTGLGSFDVILDTVGGDLSAYRRLLGPKGRMIAIVPVSMVRDASAFSAQSRTLGCS